MGYKLGDAVCQVRLGLECIPTLFYFQKELLDNRTTRSADVWYDIEEEKDPHMMA
jgi:hypothetical protein